MTDLPNGLRLYLNKSVILSVAKNPMHQDSALDPSPTVQDDTEQYLSRTAIAQIRVGEVEEEISVVDPPIVIDPPVVDPPITEPPIEVRRLELAIDMVPLSERGFLYDSNQPIDINNPLQIINRKEGGYSSIFVRDDDFLQISIGSVSKKLGNETANIDYFDKATLSLDTVTLSFLSLQDDAAISPAEVKITEDRKVSLDIDPRGRTSYSVAKKDFIVNGVTVPAGTIITGIKKVGVYEQHAEIGEFEQFRAYDPKTGALVTYFGQGKLKDAGCAGSKDCFDVKQFAQPEGTTQNNARVFYSFSLQDLMPSSSAYDSVDYWINIQKDLTENMTTGLNSKDEQWQKEELKALNDALSVYTGNDKIDSLTVNDDDEINRLLDEYKSGGINALKRSLGISDELPTLSRARYSDDELVQLQIKLGAKNDVLAVFALTKLQTWADQVDPDGLSKAELKKKESTIQILRQAFVNARDDYNAYIQEYGSSPNTLTKRELEDLLKDPNLPDDIRKEYESQLEKINEAARIASEKKAAEEQKAARKKELQEQKKVLNNEITKLKKTRKSTNDKIATIETKIKSLKKDISDLEKALAKQKTKNKKAKSADLEKKKTNLTSQTQELARENSNLTRTKSQISQKETELQKVINELNGL